MNSNYETIPDAQKELCAVNCMRMMLETFHDRIGMSYQDAFILFSGSDTYNMLFDFDTGLWHEGPLYLYDTWISDSYNTSHDGIKSPGIISQN